VQTDQSENPGLRKNDPHLKNRFVTFSVLLFLVILVAGSVAYMFSMRQIIRKNKGDELTRILEYERIKLETSVNAEITIVLKLASSPLIKRYFSNPNAPELKTLAFEEFSSYRSAFNAHCIFWVNDIDKIFYIDDNDPYLLDPAVSTNYWYNMTLYETEVYNFNINYNPDLKVTRLWINAPVFDAEHKPIGMVGTGIDLSAFISTIYQTISDGVDFYCFNAYGEITGAKNIDVLVKKKKIDDELEHFDAFNKALQLEPGETRSFNVPHGKIATGTIPLLKWYSVAFVPDSINDYKTPVTALFFTMFVVIALSFIIFNVFIAHYLKSLNNTLISLEVASRAKSDFLARMSHEIRTPMNAIIGIAQIGLQKEDLPREYTAALDYIYGAGNNLLGIINDILDMSKIESGKIELNLAEYDLPNVIYDTIQLNMVHIGSKQIELQLDISENLPAKLIGDELRLKQILSNLLSNAFKYTEQGYVKLTVDHSVKEDDVMLRFIVEDTGQGMKPEDLEKLFSEYLRFNRKNNRIIEGVGLGLTITKGLVEIMSGTVQVESEYGKGSKFTVVTRQKAVGDNTIGSPSSILRAFTFTSERKRASKHVALVPMPYGKVLVVDDVDTNLYVAEGMLMPYELTIETAKSGFAVIDLITGGKTYDIIFMDHMMPQMDGIETTQKLRALGYTGAIVALTANALVGNEEMFLQNGFDGFISKPIDTRYLDAALKKFVYDKYPEEAAKYTPKVTEPVQVPPIEINPKLLQIFRRDAEKAIPVLRSSAAEDNAKLFTTTVHSMKTALASVGEQQMSELAYSLEIAGRNGDREFISANTEDFLKTLEFLIQSRCPANAAADDGIDVVEDTAFLTEQLQVVKTACKEYDDTTAYAAIDLLKEKLWKPKTYAKLEEMRDMLFLHSDFDGVREQIETLFHV